MENRGKMRSTVAGGGKNAAEMRGRGGWTGRQKRGNAGLGKGKSGNAAGELQQGRGFGEEVDLQLGVRGGGARGVRGEEDDRRRWRRRWRWRWS